MRAVTETFLNKICIYLFESPLTLVSKNFVISQIILMILNSQKEDKTIKSSLMKYHLYI